MEEETLVYVDPDDDLVHIAQPGGDGVTLSLEQAAELAERLSRIVAGWRRGQIAQTRYDMADRHRRRRLAGRLPLRLRPRGWRS